MKVKILEIDIELIQYPSFENTYRASIKKRDGQEFVGYGGYITEALHNCIESLEMNCNNDDIIYNAFGEPHPEEKESGALVKK